MPIIHRHRFLKPNHIMQRYFEDMLPVEELRQLKYIPTIAEFVEWIENKWHDLPALSDTVSTCTYSKMCNDIAKKRALLNSSGLRKGDKVAILDNATPEAVEMFLAVTSAGYVAVNLPSQLSEHTVIGCCIKFDVKMLAYGEEFSQVAGLVPCKTLKITELGSATAPVAVVNPDDPAAIFFTGGTTGAPKGAVLPHRAVMRGALNGCYGPGKQLACHTYANVLPLSHVFGLIRGTMSVLYTGGLWVSGTDIRSTLGGLPQIKPTCIVAVPGICEVIMGLVKMYGKDFLGGRLRFIIAGAANVAPKLIAEFDSIGISLFAGYGMTEGGNLTSGNVDVKDKPTSVGKIYPCQEVKVVDGELWIRGDNVFLGYYGDPEKTAETLTEDGWLKTGDLARFDEDGYMYITGRIKNLIVLSNGENVSPESLEEPFYKCDRLRDCLVKEEDGVIAIEILPRMEEFADTSWEDVEKYFNVLLAEVNSTLPTTHRIAKLTVRKEDFKRTGTMKVSRI